jgi:hypothetical protein
MSVVDSEGAARDGFCDAVVIIAVPGSYKGVEIRNRSLPRLTLLLWGGGTGAVIDVLML